MKVLIPLVSKKENNAQFLSEATEGAKEIILLLVIDKRELTGQFGFAASEIMQGTAMIEQIKNFLLTKGKHAKEITEWGETESKIEHIALLQKVDKIALLEQENEYFKGIVKLLSKKLGGKIRIIKAAEEKEPEPKEKDGFFGIGKI